MCVVSHLSVCGGPFPCGSDDKECACNACVCVYGRWPVYVESPLFLLLYIVIHYILYVSNNIIIIRVPASFIRLLCYFHSCSIMRSAAVYNFLLCVLLLYFSVDDYWFFYFTFVVTFKIIIYFYYKIYRRYTVY